MSRHGLILTLCLLLPCAAHAADSMEMHGVAFPEKRTIELPIFNRPAAPAARLSASVVHRKGQARIDVSFSQMKPAILFGGDVTCYVVWAVTRDGTAENLGELLTPKRSGRVTYHTAQKSFAIAITAESHFLVSQPSSLVMFQNAGPADQRDLVSTFRFENFVDPPEHHVSGISHLKWDSDVPLELLQARKAFELATEIEAGKHASQVYTEAEEALAKANDIASTTTKGRELVDASRRAVALSNEALNMTAHRLEALRVEAELAARRAETEALEQRAAEAETAAAEAERLTERAQEEALLARAERERTAAETAALRTEKTSLEAAMVQMREERNRLQIESARLIREKDALEGESALLRHDKAALEAQSERLQTEKAALQAQSERLLADKSALQAETEALAHEKAEHQRLAQKLQAEKDEITGRLQAALSHVAETTDSARGYVVNLPDILFSVDEAELKPDAQLALAKLAGILLILPDQHVTIEGHTDSTGSTDHNLALSRRRAESVLGLLTSQGLDRTRLEAMGFGMQRPVADNATAEGRSRNRRVELVISQTAPGVASR